MVLQSNPAERLNRYVCGHWEQPSDSESAFVHCSSFLKCACKTEWRRYNPAIVRTRSTDFSASDAKSDTDPRRLLIQRIIASSGFVNAPRLSAFLVYVSEKTLMGAADSLSERSVGEAVFQRPADYDPRDDNIVRANASRLRNRLDEYFEGEGCREALRVHIRRGSYVPFFEETIQDADRTDDDRPFPESAGSSVRPNPLRMACQRLVRGGVWALPPAVFVGMLVVGLVLHNRDMRQLTPTHKLWSQLFREDRQTLIVPADSSLVITRLLVGHQIPLADYAGGRYHDTTKCDKPCDPRMVSTVESLRYTSISDLEFAVRVTHVPEARMDRTIIRYARDLGLNELKEYNLILAGSQEADPWMSLISGQMSFVLHDDPSAGPLRVENKRPEKGELSEYPYDFHNPQHQGLATVAFLPNLSGNGSLLVVQGFSLAGTQAAAEFVTSGNDLDKLLHAYAGSRSKLPHFEILLSTTEINGMAAHPVPLALHILP